jgi:hypothetical protein
MDTPPSPLSLSLAELYKQSLKPADSKFNLYFARPLAAPIVAICARTPITPNQITFMSTFIMILALVGLVYFDGGVGLWIGVIGIELSYIFDCVDGQLARVTGRTSEVGGLLDFMMDELKAYLLLAAITLRLYWFPHGYEEGWNWGSLALMHNPWTLVGGLASVVIFASAISLTRFRRTPEYAQATGRIQLKNGQAAGEGKSGGPLWPIKMGARLISQYPTSIPFFMLFNRLDLFLYSYTLLHLLYAGVSFTDLILQLGRFASSSKKELS